MTQPCEMAFLEHEELCEMDRFEPWCLRKLGVVSRPIYTQIVNQFETWIKNDPNSLDCGVHIVTHSWGAFLGIFYLNLKCCISKSDYFVPH